jgi:murein DD-endopeptidase MepM/ murein hydrolase activator NlpD
MKPGLLDVNMPLALAPPMDKGRARLKDEQVLLPSVMSVRRYEPSFSALPMEMRTGPGLFGARRGVDLSNASIPYSTLRRSHEGIDLLGRDQDVYAAADGTVLTATNSGDDNTVEILHEPIGGRYEFRRTDGSLGRDVEILHEPILGRYLTRSGI